MVKRHKHSGTFRRASLNNMMFECFSQLRMLNSGGVSWWQVQLTECAFCAASVKMTTCAWLRKAISDPRWAGLLKVKFRTVIKTSLQSSAGKQEAHVCRFKTSAVQLDTAKVLHHVTVYISRKRYCKCALSKPAEAELFKLSIARVTGQRSQHAHCPYQRLYGTAVLVQRPSSAKSKEDGRQL